MKKILIIGCLTIATAMAAISQSTNFPSATKPPPEVREVASKPSAYLGNLTLTGVVGIVTPHEGFVLVDNKEYQEEGFGCLASDEPTKISVRWTGTAPKVREKVRVQGRLTKGKTGYAFTAEKVEKQ